MQKFLTSFPISVAAEEANLDFFPLSLYDDVKSPDDFDEVKAAGFNMVHTYHRTQTLDEAIAYLETAEVASSHFLRPYTLHLGHFDSLRLDRIV